jgi:hypothetical protein
MPLQYAVCKCGKLLIRDDDNMKISHEAPECDGFLEIVSRHKESKREVEILADGKLEKLS